jgi:surface-anchored protein
MNHQIAIISLLSLPSLALEPIIGHIDIDPSYNTTTQLWTWQLLADGVAKNPEQSFMPGRDLPAGTSVNRTGERHVRPASSAWDFMGISAGENVWIYTQLNNQYAWLGFHDPQTIFTQALQVKLAGVDGPPGGHFSLYNTSTAVFMKTSDGITSADVFPKPLSHNHINWAFSKKGMWRVRLTIQGYVGAGSSNPTTSSQEVPLYFAIGHRAQWRATHFSHSTVMNDAIAADLADGDDDGIVNLHEYAFGGHPTIPSAVSTEHGGTIQPTMNIATSGNNQYLEIRYYRRLNTQPVEASYQAQFSSSLAEVNWQTQTIVQQITPINAQWELVTVRDSQPISSHTKRFARIKVSAL